MVKWAKNTTVKKLVEKMKKSFNYNLHSIVLETDPCNYGVFTPDAHGDKTLEQLSSQIKSTDEEEQGVNQIVKMYILPGNTVRQLSWFLQIMLGLFVIVWTPIATVLRMITALGSLPQYFLCHLPTGFFHYAYAVTSREKVITMPTAITFGFYKLFMKMMKFPFHLLFELLWTPFRTMYRFLSNSNTMTAQVFKHNLLGVFRDSLCFYTVHCDEETSIRLTKEFVTKMYAFNSIEPKYPTNIPAMSWQMYKGGMKKIGNCIMTVGKAIISPNTYKKLFGYILFMFFEILRLALYVPLGIATGSVVGVVSIVTNTVIGIPAFFKKSILELKKYNLAIKIVGGVFVPLLSVPFAVLTGLTSFFVANYVAIRGFRDALVASRDMGETRIQAMKEGLVIMLNGFVDVVCFSLDIMKE